MTMAMEVKGNIQTGKDTEANNSLEDASLSSAVYDQHEKMLKLSKTVSLRSGTVKGGPHHNSQLSIWNEKQHSRMLHPDASLDDA
jgi:hypothetical protein